MPNNVKRYSATAVLLVSIALQTSIAFGTERPVSATDLASLRDIGGHARGAISVSPDGRWVVFQLQSPMIDEGNYKLSWIAVSLLDGVASVIADGGDVILNPAMRYTANGNRPEVRASWSPDSQWFSYLVRERGRTQVWQSRPDRKGRFQLTNNVADVIDFAWSADGGKLYFRTGLDSDKLQKRHIEEGARGFLYDDRFFPRLSTQPIMQNCGDVFTRAGAVSLTRGCEPDLWIYDVDKGEERRATSDERMPASGSHDDIIIPEPLQSRPFSHLRRSVRRDQYAWLENVDPATYQGPYPPLTLYALVDAEIRQCSEEACQAYRSLGHQDLWWRENGESVLFLRHEGHNNSQVGLYAWSPATGALRRIVRTDGSWLSDCAPASDRLVCLHESRTQPRTIVSVSLEDGSIKTLYDPNPEFTRHRFSKVEKLEWEDAFGNATHGHLVYPIDYNPQRIYPLVIVTYRSRGFLRGGVGDEYPIHPLAAEGFFVLSHDMPTDRELGAKEPRYIAKLIEDQYRRRSVLSSQERIVEELARAGLIDRARVAITGLSEGASQTTYGLIHSDAFAVAIASGVWGSTSSHFLENEKVRRWWQTLGGDSPNDPNGATHLRSIGLNAVRANAPLLVNVSDQELLGSVENFARLKDANKPIEMYVYPDEYHIKWQPDHRLTVYRRNIQWLKFWLKGEEEIDPVSPGQYTRWRKMRDERCSWDEPEEDKPAYCEAAIH